MKGPISFLPDLRLHIYKDLLAENLDYLLTDAGRVYQQGMVREIWRFAIGIECCLRCGSRDGRIISIGLLLFIFSDLLFEVHCTFPFCRNNLILIPLTNLITVEFLAFADGARVAVGELAVATSDIEGG